MKYGEDSTALAECWRISRLELCYYDEIRQRRMHSQAEFYNLSNYQQKSLVSSYPFISPYTYLAEIADSAYMRYDDTLFFPSWISSYASTVNRKQVGV